jgi:ATP synthase protein I
MVGWSIAVPTVGGAFLGLWLDRVAPQGFNWTLALILGGVVIGGFIAAAWINKEGGEG